MNLGRYRLLTQLGAGAAGVAYRGCAAGDESPVEVRLLEGAFPDRDRWKLLVKRLRSLAMLEHPAVIGIRELCLEREPPYVVLEWVEAASVDIPREEAGGTSQAEWLKRGQDLCAVMAAAHRLGLVHGDLRPSLLRRGEGILKVDLTGTEDCSSPAPAALREMDGSCRAPETSNGGTVTAATDVYSLGALLFWCSHGRPAPSPTDPGRGKKLASGGLPEPWASLLPGMLALDPTERPSLREVLEQLEEKGTPGAEPRKGPGRSGQTLGGSPETWYGEPESRRLGRFRLLEKLGEGGMGAVYRAEDVTDGTVVALKTLRANWQGQPQALRRLRKEARLLAEVNNPYVANLIELNEEDAVPYLVLEFVAGKSLGALLQQRHRLDEATAVAILADVARALVDAHKHGVVHRDIKPENILLQQEEGGGRDDKVARWQGDKVTEDKSPGHPVTLSPCHPSFRVKLCDFGLARHVLQTDSLNVTQAGAVVGTPYYAAPEQCSGGSVDARSDVYAMGATLYHLLAGRPPYLGESVLALTVMHANEPLPPLNKINPDVSDGVCQVVEKALAKNPDARYPDAEALLRDLERLQRGEPSTIVVHPRWPSSPPGKLLHYDWTWELAAPPEQLWPHVSNTDRLDRAVGVPAVQYTTNTDPVEGVRWFGEFRKAGVTNAWREHPYEWIEGRRLGVLREYSQGVFRWFASVTELQPRPGGGTLLKQHVRIEPRGLLGRLVAALEVGYKGRRRVEGVYRRIDAFVTGQLGPTAVADPFEGPPVLPRVGRQRLRQLLDQLQSQNPIEPLVAERLGEFLLNASPQEVARIRPLALARCLDVNPEQLVTACLYAARAGLLVLLWDIIRPVCRISAGFKDALGALADHEHCPACDLDFQPDFATAVEMIFRAHPQVRASELEVYCIGGPAHSPHVVAQVRVAAGETIELELRLSEGTYRLRGPQLGYLLDFQVQAGPAPTRWDLTLAHRPDPERFHSLRAGCQVLALTNDHTRELLVRLERAAPRADALTAARASTLALFRELFPQEVLSPGRLASLATMTLLVTALDSGGPDLVSGLYETIGDARAFGVLHEHFQALGERIRREGGTLVKTLGEGVLAAFLDPAAAVRVALEVAAGAVPERETSLRWRVGVHRGPVLAATINGQLDYFGALVSQVTRLPEFIRGGEVVLTQALASDLSVAALLRSRGLAVQVLPDQLPGRTGGPLHRVTPGKTDLT